MKRECINPKCKWIGKESECMDYKHPVGARLCPQCYEVTEVVVKRRRKVKRRPAVRRVVAQ